MKMIQSALSLEPSGLTEKVLMANNCDCKVNAAC